MTRRVALPALLMAPALLYCGGCIAFLALGAGGAAGAVAYVKGELRVTQDASMDACRTATAKAVASLQLTRRSESGDAICARFEIENAQLTPIHVSLERITDSTTRIAIRVGTFGDQALSQRILDEIRSHL